jgi:hypothetical protein
MQVIIDARNGILLSRIGVFQMKLLLYALRAIYIYIYIYIYIARKAYKTIEEPIWLYGPSMRRRHQYINYDITGIQ